MADPAQVVPGVLQRTESPRPRVPEAGGESLLGPVPPEHTLRFERVQDPFLFMKSRAVPYDYTDFAFLPNPF